MPIVSIIIINWNGKHLLSECLSSVKKQSFTDFEVILIDNGSMDGSVEWIKTQYPEVHLITFNSNKGFCKANNEGVRVARGEFIVLLNNDTEVEPDWLEQLYNCINLEERIAACDSKILYSEERDRIWTSGALYSIAGSVTGRDNLVLDDSDLRQPKDVFGAVACSAIYRKRVIQEIGFFDEDFFAGYEDIDWSFRALLRGYRIVNAPKSRVYHKVSSTHINNSPSFVFHGQHNVEAVFFKNMPTTLLLRYLPYHLFYNFGSFCYFLRLGRGRVFLSAKLKFLVNFGQILKKRTYIQSLKIIPDEKIDQMLDRTWIGTKISKVFPKIKKGSNYSGR